MESLRETFDREMRRRARPERSGVRVENEPHIVRTLSVAGHGWCGVDWSDLSEDTADAAIAHEVERFRALGCSFEWKYYDYDTPADLEQRLIAAGFMRQEDESVMIGEIATMPRTPQPEGIRVVQVEDEAGVDALLSVHEHAFGHVPDGFRKQLLWQIRNERTENVLFVAMAGDTAVSAARAEYPESGSSFASLWGGGTIPEWRGRGIYRALVSHRADIAAERGFRYLHVDASPDSRPILERLGFKRLARTTPYIHE